MTTRKKAPPVPETLALLNSDPWHPLLVQADKYEETGFPHHARACRHLAESKCWPRMTRKGRLVWDMGMEVVKTPASILPVRVRTRGKTLAAAFYFAVAELAAYYEGLASVEKNNPEWWAKMGGTRGGDYRSTTIP